MAEYWINPGNTGTADGTTRDTGWPNFDYLTTGNIPTDNGHTIRITALAPTVLSANFGFTNNSQTVTVDVDLTGQLNQGGITDMIALTNYITDVPTVPYVVSSLTATQITLTTAYQGPTATVTSVHKINCYRDITATLASRTLQRCSIIGGFLPGDANDSPTGISWFERTDGSTAYHVIGDSADYCTLVATGIHRVGTFKYPRFVMANNSWGAFFDEAYFIAATADQGVYDGANLGNIYVCHTTANNWFGFDLGAFVKIRNYVGIGNNGSGFSRSHYGISKGTIENLYVYGNTTVGIDRFQLVKIGRLYAANNTQGTINCGSQYYNNLVINHIVTADSTLAYGSWSQTSDYVTTFKIGNYQGNTFQLQSGGYLYRNTSEAYNVECLEFRPAYASAYLRNVYIDGLYAACTASTSVELSVYMKSNASFNGTCQYSVWHEGVQIVNWTAITLTTSYQSFAISVPGASIPRSGFVEVRVRVNGTAGYAYLAERSGHYLSVS